MRVNKTADRSRLIAAAMGKIPCDLTVGNIRLLNVFTGEIYPAEVDILDGMVVRVRTEGEDALLSSGEYYDGEGRYLIPGFIDTHMHVESTMMIPENLSRAIIPWGTTTVCTDPHEIGNVMGIEGVRFMLDNSKLSALRQYALAPSCVPAVPGKEATGAVFSAKEVGELLDTEGVIGIAEIMDFIGVYQDSERMHSIIDEGIKRDMYLQGHAPYVMGKELAAYRIGGPISDHESATAEEVRQKLRAGIHVNLRSSSLSGRLNFLVDGCRDLRWKDCISICTDDVHAKDLLTVGHINNVVKMCIEEGLEDVDVIRMATLNPAREYGFEDLGAIAPGYIADMQLVDELNGCRPHAVFAAGRLVAKDGRYLGEDKPSEKIDIKNTVDIPQIHSAEDFLLRVPEGYAKDHITVNVLKPREDNRKLRVLVPTELPVKDGHVDISDHPELCFVSSVNRYGSGDMATAVFADFGLLRGAMASTVSHDSHNLTIVYRDPDYAYKAAMELKSCGGGVCAVCGELDFSDVLELPVAGLMSTESCEKIAPHVEALKTSIDRITNGSVPVLATAVISLPVVPGYVITDLGIVDGLTQEFVPVFAD